MNSDPNKYPPSGARTAVSLPESAVLQSGLFEVNHVEKKFATIESIEKKPR
jgi:hypothetical protein